MPDKQIFFDPLRKRWKRLRRVFDIAAVVFTLVLAGFLFNVLRSQQLPELLLASPHHNYKALPEHPAGVRGAKAARPARRKTDRKPSEIPFNTGEGLRAAYYVQDDAASFSSFKEHVHQLDMLFPEWLHVNAPAGVLMGSTTDNREYPIVDGRVVHDPDEDNRIKHVIQAAHEDTEVFPHLTSYNPHTQTFDANIGDVILDPARRGVLRKQIVRFLTTFRTPKGEWVYPGLSLDIENLPDNADDAYLSFIQELYADLHPLNLRLYVNVAVSTEDADLKLI